MRDLEKPKPMLPCMACGTEMRIFESYYLDYKLSGQERGKKLHFCSSCWNEGKYQNIVDRIKDIEKELEHGI